MLKHFLVPEADQVLVSEAAAREGTQAIFEAMGVPPDDAALCTDVLIASDLRGCESHGISNQLRIYINQYRHGGVNPTPNVKVVRESAVSATLDADLGIGLQVGPRAMEMAMDKAEEFGMGAVGVQALRSRGHARLLPLDGLGNGTWSASAWFPPAVTSKCRRSAPGPCSEPIPSPGPHRPASTRRSCSTSPPRRSPPTRSC